MTDIQDQAHAHLGASNSDIWTHCAHAGQYMRTVKSEQAPSIYAAHGSAAHLLAEEAVLFGYDMMVERNAGQTLSIAGFIFAVDSEMLDAVKVWHDYVLQRLKPGDKILLEERVSLNSLWAFPPGGENLFGTADCVIIGKDSVDIFDFKFGAGVVVDADSPQVMYYAAAALRTLLEDTTHIKTIRTHIVQPRAYHPDGRARSAHHTMEDIRKFEDKVRVAVSAIASGKGGYNSGKWCRFCPLRGNCPELAKASLAVARGDFKINQSKDEVVSGELIIPDGPIRQNGVAPPPTEFMTGEELAYVLGYRDRISGWLSAVEREARVRINRGAGVPGWKLVAGRIRQEWANEPLIEGSIAAKLIVQDMLSPAQAKKVLSAEEWQTLVDAGAVIKQSTGTALAPVSDKRPAVLPGDAAKTDFNIANDEED